MQIKIVASANKKLTPASWTVGWSGDRCTMRARVRGVETTRIWHVDRTSKITPAQQALAQYEMLKQDVVERFKQQYKEELTLKDPPKLMLLDKKQDSMILSKR